MESGKTISMMGLVRYLVEERNFRGDHIFGNFWFDEPGYHGLLNDDLCRLMRRIFNTEVGKWRKIIILIMEADSLYSHKDSGDKEAFEDLKGLSQAMKLNTWVIYEMHEGLGVNKYLRDKTEISIKPTMYRKENMIRWDIINGHYNQLYVNWLYQIDELYGRYRRFDIIH
jgi:hypothetical protein